MVSRYSVRRFRAADLERILEIEHASFGKDAYDRNLFAEYGRRCAGLFLVAADERAIQGYAITCIRGPRAELVSIAVDPAARGRGAASALVESTLRRLRLRGIARIGLMVRETNAPARAFYEKYGFRKQWRVAECYEDSEDGWWMGRGV